MRRRIVIAAPALLVAAAVVFTLLRPSRAPAGPANRITSMTCGSTPMRMPSTDSSDLADFIGKQTGTRLAGNAPLNVSDAQVTALGDQVPAGASVDACADEITVSAPHVSLVVEAVPSKNPDMTFRIAGLIDPTIVVHQGTLVSVEFINADSDQAHGWLVTDAKPPFAFRPGRGPAIPGAASGVLGDPTPAGHGAREFSFAAVPAGSYQYVCPMPGHAQMGMHGQFLVLA